MSNSQPVLLTTAVLILLGGLVAAFAQDESGTKKSTTQDTVESKQPGQEESPKDAEKSKEQEQAKSPSREDLPLLEEMNLPSAKELISGERRDWVVLADDRVIIVEPVYPRPNPLKQLARRVQAVLDNDPLRYSDKGRKLLKELRFLHIFLPGKKASREYRLDVDDVAQVICHEDLMLQRARKLIAAERTDDAFELILLVARTDPDWPGLNEARNHLVVTEARSFLMEGELDRALAMITNLYERDPRPEAAEDLLGEATRALVTKALAAQRGRQARFALTRIRRIAPEHPALERASQRLIDHAASLRDQALLAADRGNHRQAALLIDRAARVWPALAGLKSVHKRLARHYQILRVGTVQLAPPEPLPISSLAGRRAARLCFAGFFELNQFAALPAYRSVYLEQWRPTDLGRRAHFQLRSQLPRWAARKAITAAQLVELLSAKLRPNSPAFDARFAARVETLRLTGPDEFEIEFSRIPRNTESILTFTDSFSTALSPRVAQTFRRFEVVERSEQRIRYRRIQLPSPEAPRRVAEVVEVGFPNYDKALRAFDRGLVRMLVNVPVWDVPRLQSHNGYVVTRLAIPRTHLIQFHPESEPLESAELRRALARSANRRELMELIAGTNSDEFARLVTAPWPSTHLGYDNLLEPEPSDLALALALLLAAEQERGHPIRPLIFAIPDRPRVRAAAEKLATSWRRIGLEIKIVPFGDLEEAGQWDLAYRTLSLPDPVRALAPLITLDPAVKMESLADLPGWLRQRLLDLERASDAATTRAILLDLQQLLAADVRCIPLFETDRYVVTRGVIRGMPASPVAVYQNVERWQLPQDYPEKLP